ncbi:MAG: GGDEF domain-containing protein [Aquabacterium sp.]|uniref:GGDEF domain-containing protein n=1 Tax=Aquabacterium sp. TaxID=1872578 RepID=UPI0025B80AE9|nr:diguanylate cyclase [Aquabacterium sp.]MBI3381637.1 GGDEF domain-containing protein [Aquabacterium sp.]
MSGASAQPITLLSALREMRALYMRGLRFEPELEARFNQASAPGRMLHMQITAATALLLFNLFLVSDWYMIPDAFMLSVKLRLFTLTPLVLALVIFGFVVRDWWLSHTPPWLTDVIAMVGTMLVAGCLGVVLMASNSPQVSIYRAGLIPVLIFGNLVQRLRFPRALAVSAFILGLFIYTTVARQGECRPYAIIEAPMGLLIIVVTLYTLISNFNLELDERQRFLQNERGQSLRSELEQMKRGLEDLSNLDPLTGLPNRRCFDGYLKELSSQDGATTAGQGMALLLIDVDHFKAFNDRYGHPAGDQCLRQVARAMRSRLGEGRGLLARWGGEEFVVVLPGATPQAAMAVAEDLRQAVAALAMRHEASTTSEHVSISVGVADPSQAGADERPLVDRLVSRADEALYRAKQDGRNRCVLAGVA